MNGNFSSDDDHGDPGIGLSLGAAFLGMYAHGGFLSGMNEAGIFPGKVCGTSAGALAGGLYAGGLRGETLRRALVSPELKGSFFDWWFPLRGAPQGLGILTGLLGGNRTVRHLKSLLPMADISETNVRLCIAVTDLGAGEGIFLTEGPLAESMMASSSVPVLFSGRRLGGRLLHDGGVLHASPISPLTADDEVHTIIVHRVVYPERNAGPGRLGIRSAFASGHRMMSDELMRLRIDGARRAGKRVLMVETRHRHPGLFQAKAAKESYYDVGFRTGSGLKL